MLLLRRLLVRPLPIGRCRLGRLLPPLHPLVGRPILLPPAPSLLPHRRYRRRQVGVAGGGDGRARQDRRLVAVNAPVGTSTGTTGIGIVSGGGDRGGSRHPWTTM